MVNCLLLLCVTDSRNVIIFALLSSMIIPTSKSVEIDKVTKIKRITKTSLADTRKSFMRLVFTTCMYKFRVKFIIAIL